MTTNLNTFNRVVEECMVATGLPRAEAERAVRRRYPELSPAPAQTGATAGTGSAERELDQRARELAARDGVSYAVAYTRVLNADASLYLRYLQEHEAALGARRG
jgi:hypothetical protein